jgi:hypothetical protein
MNPDDKMLQFIMIMAAGGMHRTSPFPQSRSYSVPDTSVESPHRYFASLSHQYSCFREKRRNVGVVSVIPPPPFVPGLSACC